ncbi:MAG: adenine phosphoribosyltransferase [Paracoccaceae bacterium]|jgi:adenine phosphoribosyltransferase|nr:adenine phosphoribosyltransferase [Paracoccaceae bacterium]MDG2247636.1 adenine phosphoribosyltransferase [Paracoccaceae bacterium]|tara:strand:- start:2567 stop:3097 length:531 start_codon:yes stop_codon:yes gene_type:complete
MSSIKDLIRTIPNFPIEGIMFRDVTTLFDNAKGFKECIDKLAEPYKGTKIDKVIGLEARGFIIGGAIAKELECGFIPIRKVGKLPSKTITQDYELEYGKATLEIHEDALSAGHKVLIVDDLLATGGTAEAGIALVEKLGGEILGCSFIVNLPDLGGSKKLEKMGVFTHILCEFEGL